MVNSMRELTQQNVQYARREQLGQMAKSWNHLIENTIDPAVTLGCYEIVCAAPDAQHRDVGFWRLHALHPRATRFHLTCAFADAVGRNPRALMRRRKRHELCDASGPVLAQICPRDQAAHTVGDERNLVRFQRGAKGLNARMEFIGKSVDASERRLKIDGRNGEAIRSQLVPQPPPRATIAHVAVDQQKRNAIGWCARRHVVAHPRSFEGLNDDKNKEISQPLTQNGRNVSGQPGRRPWPTPCSMTPRHRKACGNDARMQSKEKAQYAERAGHWMWPEKLRERNDSKDSEYAAQPKGNHQFMPWCGRFNSTERLKDESKHIVRFAS